jgi:hypothetical protein
MPPADVNRANGGPVYLFRTPRAGAGIRLDAAARIKPKRVVGAGVDDGRGRPIGGHIRAGPADGRDRPGDAS